jgi:hypothetical protein
MSRTNLGMQLQALRNSAVASRNSSSHACPVAAPQISTQTEHGIENTEFVAGDRLYGLLLN